MNENIMVSIVCNTFNQEDYIADTLDSFLMQSTNFLYEILVHDDASTDSTVKIIKEYEKKYPDLIKPIYQEKNQYSQNVNIDSVFQYSRAKGKYIAYCEGDDYWTDPEKLQKQVDLLEHHSEVDICAHRAEAVDAETKERLEMIAPADKDTLFTIEEVIRGEGGFVSTNSLLMRKECMCTYYKFSDEFPFDYAMQIQGALRGGMLYMDEMMSAYRKDAKGSWTVYTTENIEKKVEHIKNEVNMLKTLNQETNYQYDKEIMHKIRKNQYSSLILQKRYGEAICKYWDIYSELPLKRRIKLIGKLILRK